MPQIAEVNVTTQQGEIQDSALQLDAPRLQFSPENLEVNLLVGDTATQTITLTNAGSTNLDFEFIEFNALRIVSDGSWRVSGNILPGWETVDFDDSDWEYAAAPAPVNCGWDYCVFNDDDHDVYINDFLVASDWDWWA